MEAIPPLTYGKKLPLTVIDLGEKQLRELEDMCNMHDGYSEEPAGKRKAMLKQKLIWDACDDARAEHQVARAAVGEAVKVRTHSFGAQTHNANVKGRS